MKILDIKDAVGTSAAITNVSVIKQTNLWSVCHTPTGRIYNGFLLLLSGECVYEWGGQRTTLTAGSLIYLPKGSTHFVYAEERSIEFYRVNFSLVDVTDGEEIIFSRDPMLIGDTAPRNIVELCEELRRATLLPHSGFKSTSLIAELLEYVRHSMTRVTASRISAAVEYVNDHYTEEISVTELADICYLSEAHLFRLFKSELGMSPIDYKNSLRIKKAESLLCDPECSIAEIGEMLGFENACYFSRIFKAKTGLSPMSFRRLNT